jgi:sulfur carrier protein ThiS
MGRFHPWFTNVVSMVRVYLPGGEVVERGARPLRIELLLSDLGINPVEVVIAKNGRLVPEIEYADGEDEIRIYRVSHGG